MYLSQLAHQSLSVEPMKVDCEAQNKYLNDVEASARKAEKDNRYAEAYIMRTRALNNTYETRDDCR